MPYPPPLQEIIDLFVGLAEGERREMLQTFASQAPSWEPRLDDSYDFAEVRKDTECSDTVGIYLRRLPHDRLEIRVSLGPEVQTLTRALTSLLCRGLSGCPIPDLLALSAAFIPDIVGSDLIRLRSRTVYYLLHRIQSACRTFTSPT